jgi:predicted phage tail protein
MSKYQDKISARGAGGGGGKSGGGAGRAPIEAPDSLRSRQYARVLDLICEGEIEGPPDGLKSVYLDGTPIQNQDGSYNFSGVTFLMRNGTQDQEYIPGFGAVESEKAVGSEVTYVSPVTRTITNTNVDAVRVTLSIPQLTLQNTSTGDLSGASVTIAIDVQTNGGGYIPQNLRKIFTSANFAIVSSMQARGYVESTHYQIAVSWVGQQVYAPQSLTMKLQYRAVSDVTWLDYESFTFNGGSFNTPNAFGSISTATNNYPSGSRTFSVTLPNDEYEFQLVKTNGSIQNPPIPSAFGNIQQPPSVGTAYGGTVSISSGTIYQPVASDVITGKTTKRYQRDYRIELPGNGPWDIRVRRITADSVQTVLQDKTYWDSYTEIIDSKLRYPNSVVAGLQVAADQFNSIPVRSYLLRGQKIRIPSNYDPILRTYDGSWDGTFVTAWSNNPAWVFYDLLTAERYGLGSYLDESQVDKWALYTIARYCDEMVDDGYGGIEPRFTLNIYIQAQEDAYQVISNIASIFRAMAYWSAGTITAVQDAPSDPVALFTCANVIDGTFNYSGSSAKTRHTVVLVAWNDPLDSFKQKIEYVEDTDGIARYGYIQTQVYALGCTSRGQAHRYGRAIIYTEQMESETISFGAGLDGTVCYPGAIIQVQDQFRSGARMGGRLIAGDTLNVTLDSAVTLDLGKVYTLSCVLPDGTIEDRTIGNAAGVHTELTVTEAFSNAPQEMSIWMVTTPTLQATSWRIVSVSEPSKGRVEISALAYRPDKYEAIENNLVLEPINYSNIGANPDPVSDLSVTETLALVGLGIVGVKATVSWDTSATAINYIVRYNRSNGNITELSTANNTYEISPLEEGTYTFTVIAVNSIGRRSQPTSIDVTIFGKTVPPVSVSNFYVNKVGGVAVAAWDLQPDLDVQVGGHIVVRHSPLVIGATWQDGVILEYFAGNSVTGPGLPLITGTYMAKALDSSGNWSEDMVSFVATEGMVTGFNTVATSVQHPDFEGAKNGTSAFAGHLQLSSSETIGSMPGLVSTWPKISSLGGITQSGTYEFDAVMDLGSVATRRFESDITALSFDTGDRISHRGLVSQWGSVTGDAVNDCDATLLASTTDDDPSSTPVWTDYTPFFVADFTCRAVRFRLDLASGVNTHNIRIDELSVAAKEPV